jgi:hypothetical protein
VEEGVLLKLGIHHAHELVVQGQEGLGGGGREGGREERVCFSNYAHELVVQRQEGLGEGGREG